MAMMKPKGGVTTPRKSGKSVGTTAAKKVSPLNKKVEYKAGIKTGIRAGITPRNAINDPVKARKQASLLKKRMDALLSQAMKSEKMADKQKSKNNPEEEYSRMNSTWQNNSRGKNQGRLIARNAQTSRRVSNTGTSALRRKRGE
jgi:hypothetical protein